MLILSYDSTEIVPGGAGNAATNAARLGATVDVVGLVGRDSAGARLVGALTAARTSTGVTRAAGYMTPVKTRILAGGVHSAKQQVVRVDRAGGAATPAMTRGVERALARAIRRADVVDHLRLRKRPRHSGALEAGARAVEARRPRRSCSWIPATR